MNLGPYKFFIRLQILELEENEVFYWLQVSIE